VTRGSRRPGPWPVWTSARSGSWADDHTLPAVATCAAWPVLELRRIAATRRVRRSARRGAGHAGPAPAGPACPARPAWPASLDHDDDARRRPDSVWPGLRLPGPGVCLRSSCESEHTVAVRSSGYGISETICDSLSHGTKALEPSQGHASRVPGDQLRPSNSVPRAGQRLRRIP
jgi:hypothetical protein